MCVWYVCVGLCGAVWCVWVEGWVEGVLCALGCVEWCGVSGLSGLVCDEEVSWMLRWVFESRMSPWGVQMS